MPRILEEPPSVLSELGRISISFWVTSTLDLAEARPELGFTLRERPVAEPYLKSYDRFAYPDLPHEVQLLWYKALL